MSIKTDVISSLNTSIVTVNNPLAVNTIINDSISFSSSAFQRNILQDDYLVTDTYNSTSYLNNYFIDQNDIGDTTAMLSTFSIASNKLTVNYPTGSLFYNTGVSNRYMHGRNKYISINLANGSSSYPIIFTRFLNTSNLNFTFINFAASQLNFKARVSGSDYQAGDNGSIPGYNSSTNYQYIVKIFENLMFTAVIDTSAGKMFRHYSVFSNLLQAQTGTRNGLGLVSGSQQYSNLVTKDLNNYINVVCIGDSNTTENTISANGTNYVQLLNYKYSDKNISFVNKGVGGDDTAYILGRMSNIISSYVSGARNIATLLVGTNDAREVHNTWNFATTCANYVSISQQLKAANFEVWFMTYPPLNQNVTPGANPGTIPPDQTTMNTQNLRLSQINGFIRNMQIVDRVIPIDSLFVDYTATVAGTAPIVYQNSNALYLDLTNSYGIGYIHILPAGQVVIQTALSKVLEKSWDQNIQIKNLNILNGLTVYGQNKKPYNSITGADVLSTDGILNVTGQIVNSGFNTTINSVNNINNSLIFGKSGLQVPINTDRSLGTRIVLYPTLSTGSGCDFAIGMSANPGTLWYGTSAPADHHSFYNGTLMTLDMTNTSTVFGSNNLVTITNTTASTSSTTGALIVAGGLGVAGNIYSNGVLLTPGATYTQGTNISISSNVISTVTNPTFSGVTTITNATVSSSTGTGALIVTGGIGVSGALFGTTFNSSGLATLNSITVSATSTLAITNISGVTTITNATGIPSTSNTPSGALVSSGGFGFTGTNSGTTLQNAIMFSNSGLAVPTNVTSRSIGTRIVIYPTFIAGTVCDFAIGMSAGPGTLWFGTPASSDHHAFYNGTLKTIDITNTSTAFGSNNVVSITNTTSSTTTSSGALVITGGVGVGENLNVAGTTGLVTLNTSGLISANASLTVTGTSTFTVGTGPTSLGGTLGVTGVSTFNGNTSVSGVLSANNTTDSTSFNSGSIITAGGIGVTKSIYIGSNNASQLFQCNVYQPMYISPDNAGSGAIPAIRTDGMILQVSSGGALQTAITGTLTTSSLVNFNSNGVGISATSATTITKMAAVRISGPAVVGTNVTFTNNYSLYIDTGTSLFGGIVQITNNTASTSSSTGALIITGGISSSNTTNSVSATNGGTFTTAGGAAIAKDVYIGGNLNVTGTFSSALGVPGTRTTGTLVNTSAVTVNNQILTVNGTNNIYAATFSCTPTAANTLTAFVTNLPNRTTNSTFVYEIISTIQGFNGSTNISNCVSFVVTGSVNFQIQFTSIDNTNVHYIQVRANYISN